MEGSHRRSGGAWRPRRDGSATWSKARDRLAAAGGLRGTLDAMLSDKNVYRSPQALGPAYEHPERLSDDSIERYLRPLVRTEQRTRDLQRFLAAFDNRQTRRRVELKGARIFFPEERSAEFNTELRAHWQEAEDNGRSDPQG